MSGLNYGYKFKNRVNKYKNSGLDSDGVVYSDMSKKFIVRVPNPSSNKSHVKANPFISIGQFITELEATEKHKEYHSQLK